MSGQEVQVEQGQEKVGLKRKLTGPPRLLLSKFRAKNQGENKTDGQARRHTGESDSNGTQGATQDTTMDNGSVSVAGVDIVTLKTEQPETKCEEAPAEVLAGTSGISSALEESEVEGVQPDSGITTKRRTAKISWKQFWSPSLLCVKRQRNDKDRDQRAGDTCQKTQTSCIAKQAAGDSIEPKNESEAETTHCTNTRMNRNGRLSAGTWSTFKRFLIVPNGPREPKEGHLEQAAGSGLDKKRPKASLKKRVSCFLKRGGKKSSAQGVNGGPQDSPGEDTAGPSDRAVDGAKEAPSIQEGDHFEADVQVGGSCSETLMVSVEVSTEHTHDTEERDIAEGSTSAEESEKCLRMRKDEEDCLPCPQEGLERNDCILKTDDTSKNSGGLPPVMEEPQLFGEDSVLSADVGEEAGVKSLEEETHAETGRISEDDAVCVEGVMRDNSCSYGMSQESRLKDQLPFNTGAHNGIDCVRCCHVETDVIVRNGPVVPSPPVIVHPDFCIDNMGLPCRETLLVQTACSVVEAAVKAALDQLTAEFEGTISGVHRGAQASQGHH